MVGAYVTLMGALITIVLNILLIPRFGYTGAAWATFFCYAYMMVISYYQGQRHYPIPYARKKLITYIVICALLYVIHEYAIPWPRNKDGAITSSAYTIIYYATSLLFLGSFTFLVLKVEKKEFVKLPFVGKFVARLV